MFEITVDSKSLEAYLDRLTRELRSGRLLDKVSKAIMFTIVNRTHSGEDYLGDGFVPYSDRSKKNGRVNLDDTGEMLNNVSYKLLSNEASQIYIKGARNVSIALEHMRGKGNTPQRQFFGLGGMEVSVAQDVIEKYLREILR